MSDVPSTPADPARTRALHWKQRWLKALRDRDVIHVTPEEYEELRLLSTPPKEEPFLANGLLGPDWRSPKVPVVVDQ